MWSIFLPVVFMVGLTLTVIARLPMIRAAEIKANPQLMHDASLDSSLYSETSKKHANNLANLFELPVLFYVAAILALLVGATNFWTGLLAWIFVLARIAHTTIHVTSNVVMLRFGALAVSLVALALLWITLIFEAGDSLLFEVDEFEAQRERLGAVTPVPVIVPR